MTVSHESVSAHRLKELLDGREALTVLDVMTEECFSIEHLPQARNACVYNVDFVDRVKTIAPDLSGRIVVYGSSAKNLASSVAVTKLLQAGWSNVVDFRGGLEDWTKAGFPTEGTHLQQEKTRMPRFDLSVFNDDFTGGEFESAGVSDDFFESARYPEGQFHIDWVEAIEGATAGQPNHKVSGRLRLKEVERQIEFPALIGMQDDGALVAQANFDIDRTQWNILYGSGRFFEKLGMHLVNDLVSIQLKIVVE